MAKRTDEMMLFEKRAANKKGLVIVFLLALTFFGVGGYFVYKNKDNFEWHLPWEKEEETSSPEKPKQNPIIQNSSTKNTKLDVPTLNPKEISRNNTTIKVYGLEADDKGYSFKVDFTAKESTTTINIEKVLIDGHDTSGSLILTDSLDIHPQQPTTGIIKIPKTELDALNITGFKRLTLYFRLINEKSNKSLIRLDIEVFSNIDYDNSIKGLIEMFSGGETLARYYQTLTDNDNTYIYFDFLNENRDEIKNIKVKKLLINDELYDYSELNEVLYAGAEKIFYIVIPKNKVKEVKSFNISFFIINNAKEQDDKVFPAIYSTLEYSLEF